MTQFRTDWASIVALVTVVSMVAIASPSTIAQDRSTMTLNFSDSDQASQTQTTTSHVMSDQGSAWGNCPSLELELELLDRYPELQNLVSQIRSSLQTLHHDVPLGCARATVELNLLSDAASQSQQLAARILSSRNPSIEHQDLASKINRFAYRLQRRLVVWNSVNQSVLQQSRKIQQPRTQLASLTRVSSGSLDPAWVEYLFFDELTDVFDSLNATPVQKKYASRRTLARMYSPVLTHQQSEYLQRTIPPAVMSLLSEHAATTPDYQKLLEDVEKFETDPTGYRAYLLNDHYQNFHWSDDPYLQTAAAELESHYRNANVRLSLSEELLNLLLPQMPATNEPYSDHILGARIVGRNNISNQLHVKLIPDSSQLNLQLGTQGRVESRSIARRDGFTIRNRGYADFQVFKQIKIGREGIDSSGAPVAYSSAKQQLVGVESKFDSFPILGRIVRRVVEKKIQDQAPQTRLIVQRKIATTASKRMQETIDVELQKLKQACTQNLYEPLVSMGLEPETIQMATVQDQLVMRYRLAGRDQMAAHTARPQEQKNSLISLQIHQSAINNMIARMEINGRKFSVDELKQHFQELLGAEVAHDQEPSEQKAEFEFAAFDPFRIVFQDQQILVTMNLKSLKVGHGKRWKNVSVTTAYTPVVRGSQITLVQDSDGTRIKGHRLRLRDRVAISTVHKVLFKREYSFDVLPAAFLNRLGETQVEISQLVSVDGWIGISMSGQKQAPQSPRPLLQLGQNAADMILRR